MNRAVVTIRSTPVGSYFEPDVLSSHQYFQLFRQKSHFDAEEKLLLAVLTDAIECFQKYLGANAPRRRKLFTEAEAWISRRDRSWPYSFENICEALNIDPNYLRLGLMQWRVDHDSKKNTIQRIRKTLRYDRLSRIECAYEPSEGCNSSAIDETKVTATPWGDPKLEDMTKAQPVGV